MAQMHPDEWYALAQEQHHHLLQEAAEDRLFKARTVWQNPLDRSPIVHWVGVQLMTLGLRWQGYNAHAQPVVICGGTICQQLISPALGDADGCVAHA